MHNFRTLVEEHDDNWFVISDPHFFHDAIGRFEPSRAMRFGDTLEEQTESMVENWNLVCDPKSNVFVLGDTTFGTNEQNVDLINRLNGKIWLVPGNHDHRTQINHIQKRVSPKKFELLPGLVEFNIKLTPEGTKINVVLCHFPLLSWNKMHYGSVHLHGHCHGNIDHLDKGNRRRDVGYDSHSIDDELTLAPRPFFEVVRSALASPISCGPDHHR